MSAVRYRVVMPGNSDRPQRGQVKPLVIVADRRHDRETRSLWDVFSVLHVERDRFAGDMARGGDHLYTARVIWSPDAAGAVGGKLFVGEVFGGRDRNFVPVDTEDHADDVRRSLRHASK